MAYRRCRQADDADREFETLRRDYPDSEFVEKVEKFEKQFSKQLAKATRQAG
jgi:outer membrane protein assembly factor BamD (BamD/ComL family)